MPPYDTPKYPFIFGVGGEKHPVIGSTVLKLFINDHVVCQTFHILNDPPTSLILGMDFLEDQRANLDVPSQTLTLQEDKSPIPLTKPPSCTTLLRTCAKITIPATSEAIFPVKIGKRRFPAKNLPLLIQPMASMKYPLLPARAVVTNDRRKTACRVLNPTTEAITLPANVPIAKISYLPSEDIIPWENAPSELKKMGVTISSAIPGKQNNDSSAELAAENKCHINTAREMGVDLSNSCLTEIQKDELLALIGRNRDVFAVDISELGTTDILEHSIDTPRDVPPVTRPFYRQSPAVKAEIEKITDQLLEHGKIERSTSPWAAGVVLVKRYDSSSNTYKSRLCVDYRALNKISTTRAFNQIRIQDVEDALGASKPSFFSKIDLRMGYHQIRLDQDAKDKSAFVTHQGKFSYTVMPFGLKNAPVTFALAMSKIFHNLTFKSCLVYLDDIILYNRTFEEHLATLTDAFARLRKANLKLHPGKCVWAQAEVPYLGHIFSRTGVRADPAKIKVIADLKPPKDQKQVRHFLGLTGYYRRFVPKYSIIAAPLFKLLSKDQKFVWDDQCELSFQTLKKALVSPPILSYPDMTKEFILSTDASRSGIAYILSQKDDTGLERVIAFNGRSLSRQESNWGVTEIECLAVICGIKTYRHYLADKPFKIITDHSCLQFLNKIKEHTGTGRLARWSLLLQPYQYTVCYKPGKSHTNADGLSRLVDTAPEKDVPEDDSWANPAICQGQVTATDSADHQTGKEYYAIHFDYPEGQNEVPLQLPISTSLKKETLVPELSNDDDTVIDLAHLQETCPQVGPIYRYLRHDQLPDDPKKAKRVIWQSDSYGLEGDIMFHIFQPRTRGLPKVSRVIRQVVIPQSLQEPLLRFYHQTAYGCHSSFLRSYWTLRQKYFFPGMYEACYQFTQSCEDCQRAKSNQTTHRPPLIPLPTAGKFERLHMDVISFSETSEGYKYCLVITDSFTKWPEAFPLKTQTAENIADVLYSHILTRFGGIKTIVSDLGRNFTSSLVSCLSALFNVKRICTSAYHPMGNASAESVNRSLVQTLRRYGHEAHENWVKLIPAILLSYRLSVNKATGESPYFLVYGREMDSCLDLSLKVKPDAPQSVQQYLHELIKNLELAQEIATRSIEEHKASYKKAYDRLHKTEQPTYSLGTRVLLQERKPTVGKSPKLNRKFSGPYFICDMNDKNYTFRLRSCENNQLLPHSVHASRLKPYFYPAYRTLTGPVSFQPLTDAAGMQENQDSRTGNNSDSQHAPMHDAEQAAPSQANMPASQMPESQVSNTQDCQEIDSLLRCSNYKGERLYLVRFKGQKRSTWVKAEDIPPNLREEFHVRKTQSGKRRKRKMYTTKHT